MIAGEEETLDDCPERLNDQLRRERRMCYWDSSFVFIHCGDNDSVEENLEYWGGIRYPILICVLIKFSVMYSNLNAIDRFRFTNGEFEWNNFKDRIHDPVTHESVRHEESILEYVDIEGAGMLHYHKSPAVLAIFKSPVITRVNVTQSASHGINFISPAHDVQLLFNR